MIKYKIICGVIHKVQVYRNNKSYIVYEIIDKNAIEPIVKKEFKKHGGYIEVFDTFTLAKKYLMAKQSKKMESDPNNEDYITKYKEILLMAEDKRKWQK